MISDKQIPNSFSSSSGFSRVSTITKSDCEGDSIKSFENNILSSFTSSKNHVNNLPKRYLSSSCRFSKKHSLGKCDFHNQNSKSCKTDNTSSSSIIKVGDINKKPITSTHFLSRKKREFKENSRNNILPNNKNNKLSNAKGNSALSFSTECSSNGSFLSNNSLRGSSKPANVSDKITEFSNPLRLFNKNGKPLTDRMGRPLVNILGEQLVIFDEKGKVVSDSKGNQVFNSFGESAIHSTTNLYIPPSEDEPGIPLMDIYKEHILFLYDSKGHPLTDSFGRPLLCASGNSMLGMKTSDVNLHDYEEYQLKNMYSKKPLENCIRYVQIFDSDRKPLTNDCGKLLEGAEVICNRNGMPMCDVKGRPLYFRYGSEVPIPKIENKKTIGEEETRKSELTMLQTSLETATVHANCKDSEGTTNYFDKENCKILSVKSFSDITIKYEDNSCSSNSNTCHEVKVSETKPSLMSGNIDSIHSHCEVCLTEEFESHKQENINTANKNVNNNTIHQNEDYLLQECAIEQSEVIHPPKVTENETSKELKHKVKFNKDSKETIFLFNATKKWENKENSVVNVAHFEAIKRRQSKRSKKLPKKMSYSLNFYHLLKETFSKPSGKQDVDKYQYNEYGKPVKDIHGNLLYDKYGIPLTGAHGRKLSERARQSLRIKLRNVEKSRPNMTAEGVFHPISRNQSHDQFGEPVYDKYGRPLYDLAGRLIYDRFGRPLTDAFGRPLVDPIGQPLMDCEGRVLTSVYDSDSKTKLIDIFGRKLYDRRGKMLFDSYGRPKFDIFTNAVYDNCGRPATDANGKILFDFLNKPIQPFPEKPLYKNARERLPKFIDTILAVPSMYRMLRYSKQLEDVFRGPIFDDLGRPLYNKIGKPLYDRYGRPLYDKNGAPLCDCYGRPLSEDIKKDDDDQTLSVVDCLKLLKVTEESSKWMSKVSKSKSTGHGESHKNAVMTISQKKKFDINKRSGQYVYALTRVTKFASGRTALEILEAPLSPSTASERNRLPFDNKPIVMVVGYRKRQTVKKQ